MAQEPVTLLTLGDSTCATSATGIQQGWAWLASQFPAYTATTRAWNGVNESWDLWTDLQTGTAGEAYFTLPGTSGNAIIGPDNASLDVTGDLEIGGKFALDDWTPATQQMLVAKYNSTGNQRSYLLGVDVTTGRLNLQWSADGTAVISVFSTVAPTVANGDALWVKATLDVDNGAAGNTVTFYTSTNGTSWTQLGSAVVTAGTTSIFASTATLELGSRAGGTTSPLSGKIYKAFVRNGIGGPVVPSPSAGAWVAGGVTSFLDGEGNAWQRGGSVTVSGAPAITIYNGGQTGAAAAYFTDSTRFAKMTAMAEPSITLLDLSHNDSTNSYTSTYDGLCTQVMTKFPTTALVCSTQNPRKSPATGNTQHAFRNRQIVSNAAIKRYGVVDAYSAFLDTGNPDSYVNTDGVHPTTAGYTLWYEAFRSWLLACMGK
jgi:hypothetical protein